VWRAALTETLLALDRLILCRRGFGVPAVILTSWSRFQ